MVGVHRIKKLEVALQLSDQELARSLQQEISSFCRTELQHILQESFDSVPDEACIRIERLELDLQSFNSADHFRSCLQERIREVLTEQLNEARLQSLSAAGTLSGFSADKGEEPPVTFSASYLPADVFIHVLRTGAVPWHARDIDFDKLVAELLALLEFEHPLKKMLSDVLSGSDQSMRRFILQTPESSRQRIVSLLTDIDERLIAEIDQLLDSFVAMLTQDAGIVTSFGLPVTEIYYQKILYSQSLDDALLRSILQEVITALINTRSGDSRRIIDDLALAAMEMDKVVPLRWRQVARDAISTLAVPAAGAEAGGIDQTDQKTVDHEISLTREVMVTPRAKGRKEPPVKSETRENPFRSSEEAYPAQKTSAKRHGTESHGERTGQSAPISLNSPISPFSVSEIDLEKDTLNSPDRLSLSENFPWMTPVESKEYHITNAGLVLVAPFFGMIFKNLGYLDKENEFVSKEARIRAVHFSQFLVTGKKHPAECNLMLNKILCDTPVDEPLERFLDLTDQEIDGAREVLDSALKHWNVLKRTSVPVFQQTFLEHEGILTKESSWLLRIERTSVDVLIDTVPWTISIIKHPWMRQTLMVEW